MHISEENVRCLMGYIVNLTVILDGIFQTTGGNVTEAAALEVMKTHVYGHRNSIHREIRSFVKGTLSIMRTYQEKDMVVERILQLIKQYCAPCNS